MRPSPVTGTRRQNFSWWFAGLLLLLYVSLVVFHRNPPLLGDFCDWTYSGVLIARHMHGLPDARHALKHYPVPNSTLTASLAALCYFLRWQVAARVYLVLHLVFCFLACRTLGREARSAAWAGWAVFCAAFLGLGFWYGLFAFQLAIAMLFFFVAGLLRYNGTGKLPLAYGLLLVALFFTHMVPFTFACLLLVLFAAQHGRWRLLWQLAAPVLLVGWYVVARFRSGNADSLAAPRPTGHSLAFFVAYKVNTIFKSLGFVNPVSASGPVLHPVLHSEALAVLGKWLYLVVFAANAVAVVAALLLLAPQIVKGLRRGEPLRFFWIAGLLGLAAYAVLPESLLGISDPGARVLQTVIWPALLLCPAWNRLSTVEWRALGGASAVLGVAGFALFSAVAWNPAPPVSVVRLPRPVENLAAVPYAAAYAYFQSLERDEYDMGVFSTALLVNLRGGLRR